MPQATVQQVFQLQDLLTLFKEGLSTRRVLDIQHLLSTWRSKGNIFINTAIEDGAIWKCLGSGIFSVKSAYITLKTLKNGPMAHTDIHTVWKLKIPPRMQVFAWLMILNKIDDR